MAEVTLVGVGVFRLAACLLYTSRWSELIEGYFNQDRAFALVVSLIDIRHAASDLDVNMVNFLREADLPFVVVLTKADKDVYKRQSGCSDR